jgi:poly(3-hydroxybutyrate) depolymerase
MISAIGRDDPELSCIGNSKYHLRGRRSGIDRWLARCLAAVSACWWLLGCTEPDVAPRIMLEASVPPSAILGREVISQTEERIRVRGDGRDISAIVMLPDNYGTKRRYPVVLAIHNFGGGPRWFAGMMDAERLRKAGIVVIFPQAAGLVAEWQGPGITLTVARRGEDGGPIDDVAGLANVLAAVRATYRIDDGDINLAGFSQGATLLFELAKRLDLQRPGTVRRVFAVAGSVVGADGAPQALSGTDIVHYEPGRNNLQKIANFMTGEPSEAEFMPWILAAKGCELREHKSADGVDTQIYDCRDGRSVIRIYEQYGQHAWPGQSSAYDIWLLGSGSISQVKLTDMMLLAIVPGETRPVARR